MARNSIVWKISRHGKSSFVFGTMHLQSKEAYFLKTFLEQQIGISRKVFVEADLKGHKSIGLQAQPSMFSYLGQRKWSKLNNQCKKYWNFSLQPFDRLPPLMVQSYIAQALFPAHEALALDFYIHNLAQDKGLEVEGLETADRQIEILNEMRWEDQLNMLIKMIRNASKTNQQFKTMTHKYVEGKIHELYQISRKALGKYKRLFIDDRNQVIKGRIDETFDDYNFYSFGAAHLSGEKGVLHLLNAAGFKIDPIVLSN